VIAFFTVRTAIANLSGSRGETGNHNHAGKIVVMTLAARPRGRVHRQRHGPSALRVPGQGLTRHDTQSLERRPVHRSCGRRCPVPLTTAIRWRPSFPISKARTARRTRPARGKQEAIREIAALRAQGKALRAIAGRLLVYGVRPRPCCRGRRCPGHRNSPGTCSRTRHAPPALGLLERGELAFGQNQGLLHDTARRSSTLSR
jgi:hypothetical protein